MGSTNIQIAIKVRPFIERELKDKVEPLWHIEDNSIVQKDNAQNFVGEPYSFDHIFDASTTNKDVYDAVVKPLVMSCLEGINSTIFAYGQTSSGKTHTMLGGTDVPGIIMYTVEDIFKHIEETTTKNFLLRCSYLEIYNEKINDLLDTKAQDLKIREDYDQMVYVQAKEEVIRESNELFAIMKKGMKTRKIGCTDMNERSSRSHTIFKLVIQSQNKESEGSYTESSLSLVDLAGSERVGQMKMKAERQAEGVSINKSLTTLGLVIRKLSDNGQFVNYRDSKLTRLLQHSLGGNSKTLIICTVTVAASEETKSTLEFAQRAKYVKNRPIINEKVTDKDQLKQYAHLCQDYKGQIEKLRMEKIEREQTINALEGKISNIRLFTSENFEKSVKVSKIPRRRHTLGYYKPSLTKGLLASIPDSEESEESSDEEDEPDQQDSPENLDELGDIIDDNKENVNVDTPSKIQTVQKTPKETPSPVLRQQKKLLEESYENLKMFTSYEKQLAGQYDKIKELTELTDWLRNENIELTQDSFKTAKTNKEIMDQLVLLQSVIVATPVDEVKRKSLSSISEEDCEMINNETDPTVNINLLDQSQEVNEESVKLIEENELLKKQIEEKDKITMLGTEREKNLVIRCVSLAKENKRLQSQLNAGNVEIKECSAHHSCALKQDDQTKDNKDMITELEKVIFLLKNNNVDLTVKLQELEGLTEIRAALPLQEQPVKLDQSKKENDALNTELAQYSLLENENKRLKSELEDVAFELSGEQKEVENLIQQLDEKSAMISGLEKEILNLQTRVSITSSLHETERSQELLNINASLQEVLENKKREFETLQENNRLLDQRGIETKNQLEAQIETISQDYKLLQGHVIELDQQCGNLIKDNTELSRSNADLERCCAKYVEETSDIQKVLTQNANNIDALEQENAELKTRLESNVILQETLDKYLLEIQVLKDQLDEKAMENDCLAKKNAELNNDLRELNHKREAYVMLKVENKEYKAQLNALIAEQESKSEQLNILLAGNSEKTEMIESLKTENQDLQNKLDKLHLEHENISDLKILLTQNADAINTLEKENAELKSSNCNLDQNLQEYMLEVRNLKNALLQLNNFQRQLNVKCKELDEAVKEKNRLLRENSELIHALREMDRIAAYCNYLKQKIAEHKHENNHCRQQLEEAGLELEEQSLRFNTLLMDKSNTIEYLHTENDEYKKTIDALYLENENINNIQHLLQKNSKDIDILEREHAEFKMLHGGNTNLEEISSECCSGTNVELKRQLCGITQNQQSMELMEQEIQRLKESKLYFGKKIEEVGREHIELNLKITNLTTELNIKEQELVDFTNTVERKEKENEIIENDMKDQLDRFQGIYNAIETQFNDARNVLKGKHEELEKLSKEHAGSDWTDPEVAVSKLKILIKALKDTEMEKTLKSDQLKSAYEEIERLKQNPPGELEQYKAKLQKIHQNYEANMTLLNNTISKLTTEKQVLKKSLCRSESKVAILGEIVEKRTQLLQQQSQVEKQLHDVEIQLSSEKNKVESLTAKLQQSEAIVNDLLQYKKRMQEKISEGALKEVPLPRLSDEGRPLSPNELRRLKRQSIHDQRRGLVSDSSESVEPTNTVCSGCEELKEDMEKIKEENAFLDKENEDMLSIIKEKEDIANELHHQLKSSNIGELTVELRQHKEIVMKYKGRIEDLENKMLKAKNEHEMVEKQLRKQLDDYEKELRKPPPSKEDKETQATCDLHEKYKNAKRLAIIRRQEGNYLRAKLNMPPDCAVLPEDVQRQPTNV